MDYQMGATRDGVKCTILTMHAKKTAKTPRAFTFYATSIDGLANIALELQLTAPYRRSVKLANQISRFKAFLALPRKKTKRQLVEARSLTPFF